MIRSVDDVATHFLGADGVWNALPTDPVELDGLFAFFLNNPVLLPEWDVVEPSSKLVIP